LDRGNKIARQPGTFGCFFIGEKMNLTSWILPLTGNLYYAAAINLYLFFLGFIIYAAMQEAIRQRIWLMVLPVAPFILHAAIIDVLFNQGPGRLMFLETRYTLTLSERIDWHYLDEGWRGDRARWWGDRINIILKGHITGKKGA
jgi:hypothetical protein